MSISLHCLVMNDDVTQLMDLRRKEIIDAKQKQKWEVLITTTLSGHTVCTCITLELFSSRQLKEGFMLAR